MFRFHAFFRTFALIPSKCLQKWCEIIRILHENGFSISNCAMYELTTQDINDFKTFLNFGVCCENWTAVQSVALILTGCDPFRRLEVLVAGDVVISCCYFTKTKTRNSKFECET